MTETMERILAEYTQEVGKRLAREYKLMAKKGDGQETRMAIKCQYYLGELETAHEILQNVYDASKVSFGLIARLLENGTELEEIFDGAFVNISKVKKTGVYFIALTPVTEI